MPTTTPYRAPAEGSDRPALPALFVPWDDAEDKTNPIKVFYSILFSLFCAALLWAASPTIAVVFAVVVTLGFVVVFRSRPPRGFGLEVHGETLVISRYGEAQPTTVALAAVRNVEIERKAIQRVTYQQQFSDPLPTTELSGDVEVARIVLQPRRRRCLARARWGRRGAVTRPRRRWRQVGSSDALANPTVAVAAAVEHGTQELPVSLGAGVARVGDGDSGGVVALRVGLRGAADEADQREGVV
ncbi:MAG: hypothetical protein IPF99_08200, partial [Deltaproteobacteria bacterium]|nr:hypothetical protein [Deltaproteobacteria bacterium]